MVVFTNTEVNFMWAAHQVHHSSEDYNLGTAIRQSIFQRHTAWIFYLPMALFVSPPTAYVHIQFVTLYQFWIHTEFVGSLGPVEYILNTPSHHRVHHGRNPYCIDKNYGGTLIIWDRLFGTFAPERERVVYGLVHPIASWNPFYIQFCHLMHMWNLLYYAPLLEFIRCVLYLACDASMTSSTVPLLGIGQPSIKGQVLRGIFFLSAAIWCVQGIREFIGKKLKTQ
ncbi:alkylglycerol monooxygenase-like [Saccoglossus kowalevskii]